MNGIFCVIECIWRNIDVGCIFDTNTMIPIDNSRSNIFDTVLTDRTWEGSTRRKSCIILDGSTSSATYTTNILKRILENIRILRKYDTEAINITKAIIRNISSKIGIHTDCSAWNHSECISLNRNTGIHNIKRNWTW